MAVIEVNSDNFRSTAPKVTSFPLLSMPDADKIALPVSGHQALLVKGDAQGLVSLDLYLPGGISDCVNGSLPSIAHAMLIQGTSRHSSRDIAGIFDFSGSNRSVNCAEHSVHLKLIALDSKMPQLIALLKELFTDSIFPEDALQRLKSSEKSNLAVKMSRVEYHSETEMRRMLCGPDHPSAREISPQDIDALTTGMCREFISEQTSRPPLGVSVAGDYSNETIKALDSFMTIFPSVSDKPALAAYHPFAPAYGSKRDIIIPDACQCAVNIALPVDITRFSADYPHLRMTVVALGGYFGSRLMTDIREEKGLTYGISSSLCVSQEGSYIDISCATTRTNVDAVISGIRQNFFRLISEPPVGDELRTLRMQIAAHYARMTETPFSRASYHQLPMALPVPHDYFSRLQQGLATLSPNTIFEMAGKYLLPDKMIIATAGN